MGIERFFALTAPMRRLPMAARYGFAALIILTFFVARTAAEPAMGGYPFLLFFPAIIVISVLLDRSAGVMAVLLSAALAAYFFMPPANSFRVEDPGQFIPLALYVLVGLFLTVVVEALRTTAERLRTAMGEVERAAGLNRLLLEDINHRVKNHLSSATNLLRLSKRELTEPSSHAVIDAAAARIDVLGSVYRRLHLDRQSTEISAADFVLALVEDLRSSGIGSRPIRLQAKAEDLPLSSSDAVVVGLIVNELVENALKHAFPGDRPGQVSVAFRRVADRLELTVADDGIGRTPGAPDGGGSRLLDALAQQLGGELVVADANGARTTLTFPERPPVRRD